MFFPSLPARAPPSPSRHPPWASAPPGELGGRELRSGSLIKVSREEMQAVREEEGWALCKSSRSVDPGLPGAIASESGGVGGELRGCPR